MRIVAAVLPRTTGSKPQVEVRLNAWGYVVGVLDEWITQARVFYLVSGILECSLRARLNARMTDLYGATWPDAEGAVPSVLHELANRNQRDEQLARVHNAMEEYDRALPGATSELAEKVRAALQPPALPTPRRGEEFVAEMTFGGLRTFFERGKGWDGKIQLREMFRGADGKAPPPQRDRVLAVFKQLNDARNDVAHYRPDKCLTFEQPLFAAATLARWFGSDLQHVYGAIDSRETTELSVLFGGSSVWNARDDGGGDQCMCDTCAVPQPPLSWFLTEAPADQEELKAIARSRACAYHRIQTRASTHRPS
jgi:hypothetical protein